MNRTKTALALAMIFGLAACANVDQGALYDTPTRADNSDQSVLSAEPVRRSFSVQRVLVDVPRSLKVNERNSYKPNGDIVWHGDPIGDRYQQVAQILYDSITEGAARVKGDVPVDLKVELLKFHALSPRARYSVGGVHEIRFMLTMLDPATGAPVSEPRFVKADLDALGGMAAIGAEEQGLTQKVRIEQHLAHVIAVELTAPEGFHSDASMMVSLLNNI